MLLSDRNDVISQKKCFEQFDLGLDRWKRQLFMRFDLRPGATSETNEVITKLLKRVRHYFSVLDLTEFGYVWCREQGKGEVEHYHLALWVDGDKYCASNTLSAIVKKVWEELGGVFISNRRPYHFVDDEIKRLEALHRLSYLCKGRARVRKKHKLRTTV